MVHGDRGRSLHDRWTRSSGNGLDRNKYAMSRIHMIPGSELIDETVGTSVVRNLILEINSVGYHCFF